MTQAQQMKIWAEDLLKGRSDSFITGRIMYSPDFKMEWMKRLCDIHGMDVNEFYLGFQFQKAVNEAAASMKEGC